MANSADEWANLLLMLQQALENTLTLIIAMAPEDERQSILDETMKKIDHDFAANIKKNLRLIKQDEKEVILNDS